MKIKSFYKFELAFGQYYNKESLHLVGKLTGYEEDRTRCSTSHMH